MGAVERRALGLNDPFDFYLVAGWTKLLFSAVNAVHVLVISLLIECIPVGTVGERRAFVSNRFFENLSGLSGKSVYL